MATAKASVPRHIYTAYNDVGGVAVGVWGAHMVGGGVVGRLKVDGTLGEVDVTVL